eukprot:3147728-Prymnesium_polylepis.1
MIYLPPPNTLLHAREGARRCEQQTAERGMLAGFEAGAAHSHSDCSPWVVPELFAVLGARMPTL